MWILPSRSRPKSLVRFFECWRKTGASSNGVVLLDDDNFLEYSDIDLPEGWEVLIGPRLPLGELINSVYGLYQNEPWYGLIADDLVPVTKEWDRILIEAAGVNEIAYGDDGINGVSLCSHPVIGGDLVREQGWIALPGLERLYIDTVWNSIGLKKGVLHYLGDVKTEHWHFTTGKSVEDEIYSKPNAGNDKRIYEEWLKTL